MLRKITFFVVFATIANIAFAQAPLAIVEHSLPGAPITSTGVNYFKFRINSLVDNPTFPCDIVINVSESAISGALSYSVCGAMLRFKNDQVNLINPSNLIDVRNGAAYQFNTDNLTIQYDKDYSAFFKFDLTSSPKKYSIYARTSDMTELYKMGENLAYRTVPGSSLNYFAIVYPNGADTTALPTLALKEYNTTNLTFATGITIGNVPQLTLNEPAQLTATTVPYNATAGIAWKVVKGDSYATIDGDGMITLNKDTVIDIEAYAVQMKGSTPVKDTKKLNVKTGLVNNGFDSKITLANSISDNGIFEIKTSESLIGNLTFKVYSVEGKELKSGVLTGNKINTEINRSGVYFIRLNSSDFNKQFKVIIK